MHRVLFALAALLLAPGALAQSYPIDKGSYLLGGTVSFTSQGDDDDDGERLTTLELNPSFAYFVTPGLALGADMFYVSREFIGRSSTSTGIGPQLAYYFGGPTSKSYPFLAVGVSYTSMDFGVTYSGFGADLSGGMVFMVARNVGLTTEAFYQVLSLSADTDFGDDEFSTNAIGIRGGVTAFIF